MAKQQLKEGKTAYNQIATDASKISVVKHGDIGFVTAFSVPYEYENIIYKLGVGQASAIFRSKKGIHIFKNIEERKSAGKWRIAQILLAFATGQDASNTPEIKAKADSILLRANNKSFQSANLQVLNANEAFRQATVPAELSQRDRLLNNTLYAEVVKNLEMARLTLASQTPVMQLLDTPVYPLVDKRKSLLKLFVMGFVAATVLFIVLTFVEIPPSKVN